MGKDPWACGYGRWGPSLQQQVYTIDEENVTKCLAKRDADEGDGDVGPHESQDDGDGRSQDG